MIVVDSNVVAYLYLPGEYTEAAENLFEKDPEWVVPVLWRSEFRNILAGYIRRAQLSLEQANSIQNEAESLLGDSEYEIDSRSVFDLVNESECSAYDCEFVALANKLQARLVTQDKKIVRAFPAVATLLKTA